jgi:ribonuclease P protein component
MEQNRMGKKYTLGKIERLKSRKVIEQLFSQGKKFTVSLFRIYYLHNELSTIAIRHRGKQ